LAANPALEALLKKEAAAKALQARLQKEAEIAAAKVRLQDLQSDTCPLEWGHRIREAAILADEAYLIGCKELSHKAKGLVRHLNIVGA
jgi:hypothetical protein